MPGGQDRETLIGVADGEIEVNVEYDIPGFVCWMLSRQEELAPVQLDRHGRFPASASHAYIWRYLDRPVVDEWFEILRSIITRVWPNYALPMRSFSTQVSHDVDVASYYKFSSNSAFLRMIGVGLLRNRSVATLGEAVRSRLGFSTSLASSDPANSFDWLMDTSERYGLKSAFYFICGRTSETHDADYEITHPVIRMLIRRISDRGHEIGLHASYNSYLSQEVLRNELQSLIDVCKSEEISQASFGCRMHYLRWKTPITPTALAAAGVAYDSSLAYADTPGFRCGTCIDYPSFNPLTNEMIGDFRVKPLVVMERSVIADHYLGLGVGREALDVILKYKDACRRVRGNFSLLWHNTSLRDGKSRELYESVLSA